jgi:nucleoside-diphosphate-sugar epimerase
LYRTEAEAKLLVAVIGSTGQTGLDVVRGLSERGHKVIATPRHDPLAASLRGAEAVVSLAPAYTVADVLSALPATCNRIVISSSIRKYSRFGDAGARAARSVDRVLATARCETVALNFSLIYGQKRDRTINRLIALVQRASFVPLPDGGRHTAQPIHIDDMVSSIAAALERPVSGASIDVAGPRAIPYRELVETIAAALGRKIRILPLPAAPFTAAETVAGWFGATLPYIGEFARMAEDKKIDIAPMRTRLGVEPISFEEGLRRRFAART